MRYKCAGSPCCRVAPPPPRPPRPLLGFLAASEGWVQSPGGGSKHTAGYGSLRGAGKRQLVVLRSWMATWHDGKWPCMLTTTLIYAQEKSTKPAALPHRPQLPVSGAQGCCSGCHQHLIWLPLRQRVVGTEGQRLLGGTPLLKHDRPHGWWQVICGKGAERTAANWVASSAQWR